ncbi:MAG: prepilin-type N-terminal cleavage/methylation domain-containing protein [Bryobacteraceae bacterium]
MNLNRRNVARRLRRGFSLMELLIVVAILMIIGAVAVPKINVALMSAKEMAATREIHNLITAQTQYMSNFGKYATSLTELGPPSSGQAGPSGADLISTEMAKGVKNGYKYEVQATPQGYMVRATPQAFGSTGRRTFYTDQSGTIRQNWSAEPATPQSEEFK